VSQTPFPTNGQQTATGMQILVSGVLYFTTAAEFIDLQLTTYFRIYFSFNDFSQHITTNVRIFRKM
jgi:hypothetical protein